MWEAWEYLPSLVPGRARIVEAKKYVVQDSSTRRGRKRRLTTFTKDRPRVVTAILFFLQWWPRKRCKAGSRTSTAAWGVTTGGGLKEMQLQKLGMLEAFDGAWDRRYPNETEERFEWPWQSLTMEQVALERLDFRKFIVLVSALSQNGLDPEIASSLGQINALDAMPVEAIPGYIASEVASGGVFLGGQGHKSEIPKANCFFHPGFVCIAEDLEEDICHTQSFNRSFSFDRESGWKQRDKYHSNATWTETMSASTRLCSNGLQARCCTGRLEETERYLSFLADGLNLSNGFGRVFLLAFDVTGYGEVVQCLWFHQLNRQFR